MDKPQSIRSFDLFFLGGYLATALASLIALRETLHTATFPIASSTALLEQHYHAG